MSGNGPTPDDLLKKLRETASQFDTSTENLARWAPAVVPAALGAYWLRRPLAVGVGLAGVAYLAGPQVIDAGRQWALEEIERKRDDRKKKPGP